MGSVSSDARTILAQENTSGAIPVAGFKQRDQDAPFVDFEGYGASDQSLNVSSANGNGTVGGPKTKNTASYGWIFARMIKVRITEYGGEPFEVWIPAYVPDTH